MYKCTNCKWEGEELSVKPLVGYCPVCGDIVESNGKPVKAPKKEVNLDLNGDGKVDKKDATIASKVMNKHRANKRKGKR